jgi:hypothetical protein
MPRLRHSVTFWRGEPGPKSNPRFLPAANRWTGTSVEPWPPGFANALRAELLRWRKHEPSLDRASLHALAQRWLDRQARPTGVPKKITERHVADLLRAAFSQRGESHSRPNDPSRVKTKKPSVEELADIMRRSRAAEQTVARPKKKAKHAKHATKKKTTRTREASQAGVGTAKPSSRSTGRRRRPSKAERDRRRAEGV